MKSYEELPVQMRADIGECVDAYYHGGKKLAQLVYRAVVEARKMPRWVALAFGDHVRRRLVELGYLEVA